MEEKKKKNISQDMSEKQQQPGASLLQLPQTAEGRPSGSNRSQEGAKDLRDWGKCQEK